MRFAIEKKDLIDEKKRLEKENEAYRKNLEKEVAQRTASLQKAVKGAIDVIADIVELKDPYTAGHEKKVGLLSYAIAKKLGLDETEQKRIYYAGYLHDIGKLLIASEILSKPGKLAPGEFLLIKEHANSGYELAKRLELPWDISKPILQHHERLNGSGYPNGLTGPEIERGAKILAVADVVEAMTAHRPYRSALGLDAALKEIESNKGTLYDTEVVEAAIMLFEKDGFDFSNNGAISIF